MGERRWPVSRMKSDEVIFMFPTALTFQNAAVGGAHAFLDDATLPMIQ